MSHADIHLAVAESRTIYDVGAIDRAIEEATGNRNEAQAALYDKMKQRGGARFLVRPSHPDMVDDLYDSCPNFGEVVDDIRKSLALSVAGSEPLSFTPILLLGELRRKEIIETCGITNNTLKSHIRRIYRKLGAARRDDLAGCVNAAGRSKCATSRSSASI